MATGYGERSMNLIKRDIARYRTKYQAAGMQGIFFDEGTDWCALPVSMACKRLNCSTLSRLCDHGHAERSSLSRQIAAARALPQRSALAPRH